MPAGGTVGAGAARATGAGAAVELARAFMGENAHQLAHFFAPALGAGNLGAGTRYQFLEVTTALGAMILVDWHDVPLT